MEVIYKEFVVLIPHPCFKRLVEGPRTIGILKGLAVKDHL